MAPLNLSEYEEAARQNLSEMAYDYFAGGSDDEVTLRRNREAFEEIGLLPRVLVDVSKIDTASTVLGRQVSMPVLLAPVSAQKLAHPDGELAAVRAAGSAGTVMILSTLATAAVEDVVEAASGAVWFQLYVYRDREVTADLVARAEAAGCEALVVTVDAPWLGNRERDIRNSYHFPEGIRFENLLPAGWADMPYEEGESGLASYISSLFDPGFNWDDLVWLRQLTELPLLIKGVMRADDAARGVEAGVDGIIVSNHGGRQLDSAAPTIRALPSVIDAVSDRCEVLIDGGVRRGTDVVKALALGARAVLIGRPILWGLAADQDTGLSDLLELLRREIELAMALSGSRNVGEIGPDLIA